MLNLCASFNSIHWHLLIKRSENEIASFFMNLLISILGAVSIKRCRLTSNGIPMLKIRRSRDRLIFNMGTPIPGKDGLYIETWPCCLRSEVDTSDTPITIHALSGSKTWREMKTKYRQVSNIRRTKSQDLKYSRTGRAAVFAESLEARWPDGLEYLL